MRSRILWFVNEYNPAVARNARLCPNVIITKFSI